jgi:hypothetical protein
MVNHLILALLLQAIGVPFSANICMLFIRLWNEILSSDWFWYHQKVHGQWNGKQVSTRLKPRK